MCRKRRDCSTRQAKSRLEQGAWGAIDISNGKKSFFYLNWWNMAAVVEG